MLTLGLNGGFFRPFEDGTAHQPKTTYHDSAAVLLRDGEIISAVEQERIDRIKHSNKIPLEAAAFCLQQAGVSLGDVDRVAFYSLEPIIDGLLHNIEITRSLDAESFQAHGTVRELLRHGLEQACGGSLPAEGVRFVHHHLAHAVSAYLPSGFEDALVMTIDGQGDGESGRVMTARGGQLELLKTYPVSKSLGDAYCRAIRLLGFQQFDEYKVMGLAPYGDPKRFREDFRRIYTLQPDGDYILHQDQFAHLATLVPRRTKKDPFTQDHQDFSAALQETLEIIVFYLLKSWRQKTGFDHLCLAGGVAHNSTMNGRVLASGLFQRMFVQPASHDAGCAYGAALAAWSEAVQEQGDRPIQLQRMRRVDYGPDIGDDATVRQQLERWSDLVEVEPVEDPCTAAAEWLADGKVLGWVQGRSEFGPRALGYRSIVADPRPAENKSIINAMIKKREGFRPFAPSVMVEHAEEYFDCSGVPQDLDFMVFVVPVREAWRETLGAITHVNGTARIQTVDREVNDRYWRLISAFRERTGIGLILNTSFNNNAEPIVNSVDDSVTCFLTTDLHGLVAGSCVVRKKAPSDQRYDDLRVSVPAHVQAATVSRAREDGVRETRCEIRKTSEASFQHAISDAAYRLLSEADGARTVGELLSSAVGESESARGELLAELIDLWGRRLVALTPA
ncbi:MAG: carbamoyltransferase C-terminal domain-containing protein [Acidobacteriota bacterium]